MNSLDDCARVGVRVPHRVLSFSPLFFLSSVVVVRAVCSSKHLAAIQSLPCTFLVHSACGSCLVGLFFLSLLSTVGHSLLGAVSITRFRNFYCCEVDEQSGEHQKSSEE